MEGEALLLILTPLSKRTKLSSVALFRILKTGSSFTVYPNPGKLRMFTPINWSMNIEKMINSNPKIHALI